MHDEIAERFWKKAIILGKDECWVWIGYTRAGYGSIKFGPRNMKSHHRAHRVAWEIKNNSEFPENKLALHICNNPLCVNPHHIVPGTQQENIVHAVNSVRHRNSKKTHCPRGHELPQQITGKTRRCGVCQHNYIVERCARAREFARKYHEEQIAKNA